MDKAALINRHTLLIVRQYAKANSISLSSAISYLVRRGASHNWGMRKERGVYVVNIPKDSPKVSTRHLLSLQGKL